MIIFTKKEKKITVPKARTLVLSICQGTTVVRELTVCLHEYVDERACVTKPKQ